MALNPDQFGSVQHNAEPFQYQMLIPAKQLRKQAHPGDWEHIAHYLSENDPEGDEDPEEVMWQTKQQEAEDSGLADDIARNGIKKPVVLTNDDTTWYDTYVPRGSILNGHHRVAVANELNPDTEVPVHWVDPYGEVNEEGLAHHGGSIAEHRW